MFTTSYQEGATLTAPSLFILYLLSEWTDTKFNSYYNVYTYFTRTAVHVHTKRGLEYIGVASSFVYSANGFNVLRPQPYIEYLYISL